MRFLDRLLYYEVAPRQISYLKSIDYGGTTGLARRVMEQMEAEFVAGPPLTVHLPNPELLAGVWSLCRECLAAGRVERVMGDVIAGVVSRLNACRYCFTIHASMLHSLGAHDWAEAVLEEREIPDGGARAIAAWAAATRNPGAAVLLNPPFTPDAAPQIIGTALCFHYLNRVVNIFLDPLPLSGVAWIRHPMARISGRIMRPNLCRGRTAPGVFLTEEPATELPGEFEWARADGTIAGAVKRFASAAEAAGSESVDPRVRERVCEFLDSWRGEDPGMSRAWLETAVTRLEENLRPAARLALLAALAPHQVDETAVARFRASQPRDRDLINLVAWAAYSAVRRISSWLSGRSPDAKEVRS